MSTETTVIPTKYRSKIAHTLSYPIGAQAVSSALREAPQFAEFVITFLGSWSNKHSATSAQEVLTIAYSRWENSISMSNSERSQQWLDGKWEIFVFPINRLEKHVIKEKLIAALPQALPWLERRATLNAMGGEQVSFVFIQQDESVTMQVTSRLSPQITSKHPHERSRSSAFGEG